MDLKGIYIVDNNPAVHLIEITLDHPPDHVDVGQITQEIEGQPKRQLAISLGREIFR